MDVVPELSITQPVEKRVELIKQAADRMWDSPDLADGESSRLSERDAILLRRYAADCEAQIRTAAVSVLADYGEMTIEEAELWTLDEDESVRDAVFSSNSMAVLCNTNKQRAVKIFAESAKRYGKFSMEAFDETDPEWLDLLWAELGPLLDLGNPELTSNIVCGILEDIVNNYAVFKDDDPHLQAWINGDSVERKMALLSVAEWAGVAPVQHYTVRALAKDPSNAVSSYAKALLCRAGLLHTEF